MRTHPMLAAAAVAALAAVAAHPAAAQSDDGVAYYALSSTPVGALAPVAPVTPAGPGRATMLRYSRLQVGDDLLLHSGALRLEWGNGARTGWTIGIQSCDGCGRMLMTGFDLVRPLGAQGDSGRGTRLRAALAPALGVAVPTESFGGVILGAALSLPVSAEIPVGARARLVPFVQPGVGVGAALSGDGGGFGYAPLLGGGVELTGLGGGFGVSVGAQRVVVSGAETQLGAALTWRPDGGSR